MKWPKLPAAGTRPSSILARTPDTCLQAQVNLADRPGPDSRQHSTQRAEPGDRNPRHRSWRTGPRRQQDGGWSHDPFLPYYLPVRNLQVAGPPRQIDNLQVPGRTPDSMPRAIDPRVFCRPIWARAGAKPGDGGRSPQDPELPRLGAVDQGDAVVVRGDDRAVRTDRHVRDGLAARTGKVPRRRAQRLQVSGCTVPPR